MEAVTPSKQRPPRLGRFAWERGARYCEENRARLLWHFWRMIILESAFLCEMREWVEWEKKRERSLRYELGLLKSSPKVASSIRLGSKVKLGSRNSSSSSLIRAKKTPDLFLLFLLKKNFVIFFSIFECRRKENNNITWIPIEAEPSTAATTWAATISKVRFIFVLSLPCKRADKEASRQRTESVKAQTGPIRTFEAVDSVTGNRLLHRTWADMVGSRKAINNPKKLKPWVTSPEPWVLHDLKKTGWLSVKLN